MNRDRWPSEHLTRRWNEIMDEALRYDGPRGLDEETTAAIRAAYADGPWIGIDPAVPPAGIISAVTAYREPAPPVTLDDIMRTIQQIQNTGWATDPRLELHHGPGVPEMLAEQLDLQPVRPWESSLNAICGLPMIPDGSLVPGEWRVVDERGAVRATNATWIGFRMAMNTTPFEWRFGWRSVSEPPGSHDGDVLDRIDAAIEAWELAPDAYRYCPEDEETDTPWT